MEVSLYFHIPFCRNKCPYCHFFVLPNKEEFKTLLMEGLFLEWKQKLPLLLNTKVVSIYFGGGTPPLIGLENIDKLLSQIRSDLTLSDNCEITMEFNPEEVTFPTMEHAKQIGINRISIGVQSLDDSLLQVLDRRHKASLAIEAIETTNRAGLHNLSIDLMYDLPGQTIQSFKKTLHRIQDLQIEHLSLYNLTIEPSTHFYKNRSSILPTLPTDEQSLEMLKTACDHFEKIGLKRYEISAFAKDGKISCHNTGYWTGRPFLGYGPSAYSYFDKKRFRNICNLQKYSTLLKKDLSPVDFEENLTYPHNLEELLAVELRLLKGVDLEIFQKRHGRIPDSTFQKIDPLIQNNWLTLQKNVLSLTSSGMLFYDSVATEII